MKSMKSGQNVNRPNIPVLNQQNIKMAPMQGSSMNQRSKMRNASNDLQANKLSIKIDQANTQLANLNLKSNSRNAQLMKGQTNIPVNGQSSFSNGTTHKMISQKAQNLSGPMQGVNGHMVQYSRQMNQMQSYGQVNIQQLQQAMMNGPINPVEAMKYSKQAVA
jgi:hypothetical protein